MKNFQRLFVLCYLLIGSFWAGAQRLVPHWPDSLFSTYYHQRVTEFRQLPQTANDIIFLGNSITDGGEWTELFQDLRVKNRGISGDVTAGVLNRLDEVINRKPAKVFLLIGVNDLARGIKPDSIVKNILSISRLLQSYLPTTRLYVQSILPVNASFKLFGSHTNKNAEIRSINAILAAAAEANGYTFIDLHSHFADSNGLLKAQLTNDGLHQKGDGYLLWKHLIFPYVFDLTPKPALIPAPRQVNWNSGFFKLNQCNSIVIKSKELNNEAVKLQDALRQLGYKVTVNETVKKGDPFIALNLAVLSSSKNKEAYELEVKEDRVTVSGNSAHAVFNGIQTFLQLCRNGATVDLCSIKDEPAFSWRGYMVDVGRNYMSVDLLKQQIDEMSRYKLNIFHFHPTEDIAWRIAIKQYPQLTAPEFMLRNKGMYYTEQDIQDLIAYCKERYITFVPEIDMPGHSAAFQRAMKVDMQSDSGVFYVKNILKEFCETYDVPYIHIGADEVKIHNQQFIPEMTQYIESFGKKVIGWQPGGNFTNSTIRQLWMEDKSHLSNQQNLKYIDSRHLYLNHIDPLETVVTLYNRKIGDREKGDASMLGATLCTWHDRAVRDERDILTMNAVYPGIMAFAERIWNGGGIAGWVANISDGNESGFKEFEHRVLDHKKMYFKGKPFPYVQQSNQEWKLFGPYNNNGDLKQKFAPEINGTANAVAAKVVTGGTIVLRHWWAPLIKGAIDKPEEKTTWYATTTIWSEEAGPKDFWIGFYNLSRSQNTDSPPAGAWDYRCSEVWVNGQVIAPPDWNRREQKGNYEIPLIDEGYEYRKPTRILLKKGKNEVLIKAPISSFAGKDWPNPAKWMFTFVPVN